MKKTILTLLAAAAAVFAFTPSNAEAGGYQSRVISRCGQCNQNVYAYYRPVSYCNSRPVYGWVTSQHSNCGGHSHSSGYGNRGYSGPSYGGGGSSFSFSFRSGGPSYSNRGYSSGYGSRGYSSNRSYGGRSCR